MLASRAKRRRPHRRRRRSRWAQAASPHGQPPAADPSWMAAKERAFRCNASAPGTFRRLLHSGRHSDSAACASAGLRLQTRRVAQPAALRRCNAKRGALRLRLASGRDHLPGVLHLRDERRQPAARSEPSPESRSQRLTRRCGFGPARQSAMARASYRARARAMALGAQPLARLCAAPQTAAEFRPPRRERRYRDRRNDPAASKARAARADPAASGRDGPAATAPHATVHAVRRRSLDRRPNVPPQGVGEAVEGHVRLQLAEFLLDALGWEQDALLARQRVQRAEQAQRRLAGLARHKARWHGDHFSPRLPLQARHQRLCGGLADGIGRR